MENNIDLSDLDIQKLTKLGFNVDFVSKQDLDDLKRCFISISETEEVSSRNYEDIVKHKLKKETALENSISSKEHDERKVIFNKDMSKHTRNPSLNKKTYKEKIIMDNKEKYTGKNFKNVKNYERNIDSNQLPPNEYINLLEETKRENYILQTKIIDLEEKISILNLEKEKNNTVYRSNNEILNMVNKEQKLELDKLKEINDIQEKKLKDILPKIEKYHEIVNEKNKLLLENERINELVNKLTSTNQSIVKDNDLANKKLSSIIHENENLNKDKMYLSKDNLIKDEKISLLTETISNQKIEIDELKQLNKSYLSKISDVNREMDKSYYEKYKNEINEIKMNYNHEIENLKKFYEEISSTKINILSEERNELKLKINSLELAIKDKSANIEFLNDELRNIKFSSQEECNFVKIKLRSKEDELERIKRMNLDFIEQIKNYKSEIEAYKEKNDMIRLELINKECMFKEENVNLKAEVSILKESKQQYDKIENELDRFIVDSSVCEK